MSFLIKENYATLTTISIESKIRWGTPKQYFVVKKSLCDSNLRCSKPCLSFLFLTKPILHTFSLYNNFELLHLQEKFVHIYLSFLKV